MPRPTLRVLVAGLLWSVRPAMGTTCDPNCDAFVFVIAGTPAAAGTIVIAPLVGLALHDKPDAPYWRALGLTAVAAGIGWGIGAAVTLPEGEQVNDSGTMIGLVALPVALGTAATILAYRSRRAEPQSRSSAWWEAPPEIALLPGRGGVRIALSWRL